MLDNIRSLPYIGAELILAATILLVIIVDLIPRAGKSLPSIVALLGLAMAGVFTALVFAGNPPARNLFMGMYADDGYAQFFKLLFLGVSFIVALFSIPYIAKWEHGKGEYFVLLLSCTVGMCLMASANDLLMMYLALEFVSITSYILAGFLRHNRKSTEASLKYIIFGAAASGVMIYGMSYLYGMTGTTNIREIGMALAGAHGGVTIMLLITLMVMAGFGYKIAAAPFHAWSPDVYEGSPTPVTAFFSVGPKAAGFAMLIRFVLAVFGTGGNVIEWGMIAAALSLLTMAIGNFCALQQSNLKRLMAYSSIAHAGYMLLAMTFATGENVASIIFYLVVYLIMNLGAFLVILVMEERYGVETVEGCRGLGWRAPGLCALMVIFLLSLTGLPPFAGFIGKLLVFGFVVKEGLFGIMLVVVAVIFSVISLYYYARIIGAMFLKEPQAESGGAPTVPILYTGILWLLAIPTVLLGISWGWLYEIIRSAALNMLGK